MGSGHLVRPKVDIQLKATRQQGVEHPAYSWALDIDHYDSLRAPATLPHLLVVLLLPADIEQSVEHTAEQLVLRRCAYWVKMTGMEAAEPGQKAKTVRLRKAQLFSPAALSAVLEKISQGAEP